METIQQILIILGIIALVFTVIFLIAAVSLIIHIRRKVTEVTDRFHILGQSLTDTLRHSGKAMGMVGGSGMLFKAAKYFIKRRKQARWF